MAKIVGLWLFLLALSATQQAHAQPVCNPSVPGSVACESQAVSPVLTDILSGTQAVGPSRANQSVKVSLSQVLNLAGSTQYLPFSGGPLTGLLTTLASGPATAGFNLPPGTAPTAPNNGDFWTTATGAYVELGGVPTLLNASGGGVNGGSQYALGYYASAGNTISGLASSAGSVLQTNSASAPSFSKILPAGLTLPTAVVQIAAYATPAGLPVVSVSSAGQEGFVTNCQNGSESTGTATGCLYLVNNAGGWIPRPSIPTQAITIGGQVMLLGGVTVNQGTGAKLATFTGTSTSGDCVNLNATGALQDAGGICGGGGGGGSGTVSSGTLNQLAWYSSTGTAVAGLATANSSVLITSGAGVPSLATVLPAGLTLPTAILQPAAYATSAALPTVTVSNAGQLAFVTNCLNGSQTGGGGTGCVYVVSNAGVWAPAPNIPTQQITVGGQALYLGGATTNEGNGAAIATFSGAGTSGHCVSINATGALIDAGSACGATGGSGTVTSGTVNQMAWYSSTGTAVAGLTTANSSVLITSASGVPSMATTLPGGLTLPSVIVQHIAYATSAGLPTVTTANAGQEAFVSNCINGNEGTGTGCFYLVNNAGAWVAQPRIPTQTVTVGGQALYLGQATTNEGNGSAIATFTGAGTSGHCVSINATGALIDAGAACGGGGGGGTVSSGTLNQIAWYSASGTAVAGLSTANSSVLITSGAGVPSMATTLPGGLTLPSVTVTPVSYATSAGLPAVTTANAGQEAFVTNCLNGSEGAGTGCLYVVNNAGAWAAQPRTPTQQITIGGQALYLGGATTNEGNGSAIATFSGAGTSGHCVSINATGALIDAGAACAASGSNGTVTAGTVNQMAWYAASGTAVAGLASVNNSVLGTNGSGVPGFAATLPSGLTIPAPTISNPALTGAGTFIGLTGSGKLLTAASTTTQAGFNVLPGVAPTTPANGDMWSTTTGFFIRYNGGTFTVGSGNGTITAVTVTAPVTGGGTTGSVALGCTTCVTASAGGALAVTSPLTLAGSTVAIGPEIKPFIFNADQYTTVAAATYTIYLAFPYATGAITSVKASTGGTGTPSFTIGIQVNGVNVTSCSALVVSATTPLPVTTCGANTITLNNPVTLVLSGVNGAPSSAVIQVNTTASAI